MPNCSVCHEPGPDFTCRKCLFGRPDGGPPPRKGKEEPKPKRWSQPPDRPSYDALLRLARENAKGRPAASSDDEAAAPRAERGDREPDAEPTPPRRLSAAERAARARKELEGVMDGWDSAPPEPVESDDRTERTERTWRNGRQDADERVPQARREVESATEPLLPDDEDWRDDRRRERDRAREEAEARRRDEIVEPDDAVPAGFDAEPEDADCEAPTSEAAAGSTLEAFAEEFFEPSADVPVETPEVEQPAADDDSGADAGGEEVVEPDVVSAPTAHAAPEAPAPAVEEIVVEPVVEPALAAEEAALAAQRAEQVAEEAALVAEEAALAADEAAFIAEEVALAAETPAPVVDAPAPVVEAPAPVVEAPAPAVQPPAPVVQPPAPVAETPAPVAETPAPSAELPSWLADEPAPEAEAAVAAVAAAAETPRPRPAEPAPLAWASKAPVRAPRRTGELDIGIDARFDVAWAPCDSEPVVHMMVTLTPEGAPLMEGRTGAVGHVILALDVSASMNRPDRYPVLMHALRGLLRELRARRQGHVLVSIVAFAYGAETLVREEPADRLDPDDVVARLDGWDKRFSRYTDAVGALHRAGRIARDSVARDKAMPVRIYLLTDGRPQDMAGAREVMSRIARLPVDVHGFVFGDDADTEGVTQLVSGARGGTVKHVRPDTLAQAFERIGEVAHDVVANRSLLDVELRDGVTGGDAYRFRPARHRYPQGSFDRGVRFATDLGTLETGRTYSLLFRLRLRRSRASETEVCRIALRVPGWGGPRLFERLVQIPRRADADAPARDQQVQAAVDILAALHGNDAAATLRALRLRRDLYVQERRDPHVIAVIEKAIAELERRGSLQALSPAEHAALTSHTLTTHVRARDVTARAGPDAARPAAETTGAGKRGS